MLERAVPPAFLRRVDPEVGGERSARGRKRPWDLHTDERMRLLALAAHPCELDARELPGIPHEVLRAHYVRERGARRAADLVQAGIHRERLGLGGVGEGVEGGRLGLADDVAIGAERGE